MSGAPNQNSLQYWGDPALQGALLLDAHFQAHEWERHFHEELVIVLTTAGSGEVRTRFGLDRSSTDTVWVFAPGEYHGGRVIADMEWGYRAIYLNVASLKTLSEVFSQVGNRPLTVSPGLYRDPQLAELLVRAHDSQRVGGSLLQRQALWWGAMGMLFGRYGAPPLKQGTIGKEHDKVAVAKEYLETHFAESISIDQLASLVGLSRHHFIRAFSRECGFPPHAYANQLKLLAAKELLRAGRSPVQAAGDVGFYDQSHLTRLFKRTYDITPGEYSELMGHQHQ